MKATRDINLDTYNLSLVTAKEDVLNPRSSTNWALFAYDGVTNRLKLADSGVGGVSELVCKLHPRQPLYGLCRVEQPGPTQSRIVMFVWVGAEVDNYRRAECATHVPAIRSFFKEVHIFLPAHSLEDVTEERIRTVACKVTGMMESARTRRPVSRQNAREEIVGTNYKRTIAAAEIHTSHRARFWARAEREEEERKDEERRRASEDRRRRERERLEQEQREAEQRERRLKEKEQKIQEHRRLQAQVEAERHKQEQLKWAQQQWEYEEEEKQSRCTLSESKEKAAEAAALVSQRKRNPREFFRQLSLSSAATEANSPSTSPVTARSSYRKYHRSLTDAFLYNKSASGTSTSPCSPNMVSHFFPSIPPPLSPTVVPPNVQTKLFSSPTVVSPVLTQFASIQSPTLMSPTLPAPSLPCSQTVLSANSKISNGVTYLHSSGVHQQPETPPTVPLDLPSSPACFHAQPPLFSSANDPISLTAVVEGLTFYPSLRQPNTYFEMDTHHSGQSEHDILARPHPLPVSLSPDPSLPPQQRNNQTSAPVQTNIRPLSPTLPSRSLPPGSPTMLSAPPVLQAPSRPLPALPELCLPPRELEPWKQHSSQVSIIPTLQENEAGERVEEEERKVRENTEGEMKEKITETERMVKEIEEVKSKVVGERTERMGAEREKEERWEKERVLDPGVIAQISAVEEERWEGEEEAGEIIEEKSEATDEKKGEESEAPDEKSGDVDSEVGKGSDEEVEEGEREMETVVVEVENKEVGERDEGREVEVEKGPVKEGKRQELIEKTYRVMRDGKCDKKGRREETPGKSQERSVAEENWAEELVSKKDEQDEENLGSIHGEVEVESNSEGVELGLKKYAEREDNGEQAETGGNDLSEGKTGVDEDRQVDEGEETGDHQGSQDTETDEQERHAESHGEPEPEPERDENSAERRGETLAELENSDEPGINQEVLTTQTQREEMKTSDFSDDDEHQLEQSESREKDDLLRPPGGENNIRQMLEKRTEIEQHSILETELCRGSSDTLSHSDITLDTLAHSDTTPDTLLCSDTTPDTLSHSDPTPDTLSHSDTTPDTHSHSDMTPDTHSHSDMTPDTLSHSDPTPDTLSHSDITPDTLLHSDATPYTHTDITPDTLSHSDTNPDTLSHSDTTPDTLLPSDTTPDTLSQSDPTPDTLSQSSFSHDLHTILPAEEAESAATNSGHPEQSMTGELTQNMAEAILKTSIALLNKEKCPGCFTNSSLDNEESVAPTTDLGEPAGGATNETLPMLETEEISEYNKDVARDDSEVEEEESDTDQIKCEPAEWHTAELKPRPCCASQDRIGKSPEEEDLEAVSHNPEETGFITTALEQCTPRPELDQDEETSDSTNEMVNTEEGQEPTEHQTSVPADDMIVNLDTVTLGDAASVDDLVVHTDQ